MKGKHRANECEVKESNWELAYQKTEVPLLKS